VVEALGRGQPARSVPVQAGAADAPRRLAALTSKPVLFVANVDEGETEVPPGIADHARGREAAAVAVSARIEADLAELDRAEAGAMRAELGLSESGLTRLVHAAYELLGLITFFTADAGTDACARSIARGATAWDAAGRVHREIQEGFVRAEVVDWSELVEAGGWSGVRDHGVLRIEGRDYAVRDGDVIHIKN
jgi:ribosome-binding ATPase YchF (GTP1/OBG family)